MSDLFKYTPCASKVPQTEWDFRIWTWVMSERGTKGSKKRLISDLKDRLDDFLQTGGETRLFGSDWSRFLDDLGREICVTPYTGAYGYAGAVITINGSPPRGTVVVESHGKVAYWWGGGSGPIRLVFGCAQEGLWLATLAFKDKLKKDRYGRLIAQVISGAVLDEQVLVTRPTLHAGPAIRPEARV